MPVQQTHGQTHGYVLTVVPAPENAVFPSMFPPPKGLHIAVSLLGCGLRQRRGEEALHRVEWLGALVCSAQDKGALESCEEYGGIVLCG